MVMVAVDVKMPFKMQKYLFRKLHGVTFQKIAFSEGEMKRRSHRR
jgi:hypothetical protein